MRAVLFLLCFCLTASGQVSYWFSQWQRKPDAKTAQEFFMLAGTNVLFTYTNNHVVINSSGGGSPTPPPGFSYWYSDGTNLWWTNSSPSEVRIGKTGGQWNIQLRTDGTANFYSNVTVKATLYAGTLDVDGDISSLTGVFYGDGSGLSNVVCTTVGLTVTQRVMLAGSVLQDNVYSNGLLVASSSAHGYSLLLPGGGYLLQPSGGSFLLP